MSIKQDFAETYRQMTDEELALVLTDRQALLPEAAAALDAEAAVRHVAIPDAPQWVRSSESTEQVRGLEDYDDYIRLRDRKVRVNRWALGIVSGMLVLKFLEERTAHRFDRIGVIVAAVGLVAFALAAAYGITLTFHYTVYKCPQCSDRFGLGDECRLCGFPRKKITV